MSLFNFFSTMSTGQHSVVKLMYPINTDIYDEICPILSYDEDELFFTRVGSPDFNHTLYENNINLYEHLSSSDYYQKLKSIYSIIAGRPEDPISSSFNQDVWYSDYYEGEVYNVIHPLSPLNNALPNSICSHYGKTGGYVIVNQFPNNGGLQAGFSVVNKIDNLNFTSPRAIVIKDFDMVGSEINISMSVDKQYIILAMAGRDSKGEKDLYLSIKGIGDTYSKPIHLGDVLNTPYNEATPFFSQNKKKLYFSSDRPGTAGGMDIFVCDRLDYSFKNWSTPVPLGQPINSPADDSHPYVAIDENSILFTSTRDGSSDIFYGKIKRDDTLAYSIDINVYIVKGELRERARAQLYWGLAYEDGYTGFFRARDGRYTYTFEKNNPMKFKAENRGLFSDVVILDPQELQDAGVREIDIELFLERGEGRKTQFKRKYIPNDKFQEFNKEKIEDNPKKKRPFELGVIPLETNSTVLLKNIYFARAEPTILPPSFPSLQKLASTLKRRTDVIIQIEGHTDNLGNKEALEALSNRRAEAIADYLIKAGVDPKQIKTKGFGSSRPITANKTEKQKAKNRRVEIRVLEQGNK